MYWNSTHAQIFFGGNHLQVPPCEEVIGQRCSAGGARDVPMLTFERKGQLLLALCFRLFFLEPAPLHGSGDRASNLPIQRKAEAGASRFC